MIINHRNWAGDIVAKDIPDEHLFLGSCKGIALVPRGPDDDHICIFILTEDDDNWFTSANSFSSFWIEDLQDQLQKATAWMENNAKKDLSGFGYVFKRP